MPATVALHETMADPEPATLAGVKGPQDSPVDALLLKVTVPANPLTAETVTVEIWD